MGWLGKLPIVSLAIAGAMAIVPLYPSGSLDFSNARFESTRAEARSHYERNPKLAVHPLGVRMLEAGWLEEARSRARAAAAVDLEVELPDRLRERSQDRLDRLIDEAYRARLATDPSWRLGVLDVQTPAKNYLAHAFLHETMPGLLLAVAVLLLVGAPLERTWGSPLFAGFALVSIPLTAFAYRLIDGSSGIPFSGGAGLAAALLGAYLVRGLGGHFLLPGWVLLAAWLAAESFAVRGFWLDDLDSVPFASFAAAIGFGALVAAGLRLFGAEAQLDARRVPPSSQGPNPIVVRAARLRSDGDPYQAFDLIQAAWREDPDDREVAEAFFAIADEVGQPAEAANAILPSLMRALRAGDVDRALEYWLPLATAESEVPLEATAAVRLGEALLDARHPEEALFSLRRALECGVSTAHAVRIVHVARDLDDRLARRAAQVALTDPLLDSPVRADLEAILAQAQPDPSATDASSAEPALPPARSMLDRRVRAEHHPIETTAFPIEPIEADLDLGFDGDLSDSDPDEAALIEQGLDSSALSLESLVAEAGPSEAGEAQMPEPPEDPPSHWNAPGLITDLTDDLAADLPLEKALISSADLEAIDDGLDLMTARRASSFDPREAETDSDMTPMMDLVEPPLRMLKALTAVPISVGPGWIELDVDERGKSKLPLSRVEAIAMVVVSGVAPRPVLILDFALNWGGDPAEPLKVIRLRSDRFEPLRFEQDADSPLDALRRWVRRLQAESGARCLPSREMLEGRLSRFESIQSYEQDVLGARGPRQGGCPGT